MANPHRYEVCKVLTNGFGHRFTPLMLKCYIMANDTDFIEPGPLQGCILDPNSFIASIPEMSQRLWSELGLPGTVGFDADSVERLDKALRQKYKPRDRDASEILLPVVGYIGEFARRESGGRWVFRPYGDDPADGWYPWIIASDGEEHPILIIVFEQLCDQTDETASLLGATLGNIRASKLLGMVEPAARIEIEKGKMVDPMTFMCEILPQYMQRSSKRKTPARRKTLKRGRRD